MRCEDVLNALNADADGELSSGAAVPSSAALEAHLAECASCRAAAEGLPAIDADLRRAFAPRRTAAALLTESTIAKIRTATGDRHTSADLSADALPVSPLPVIPLSVATPVAAAPHLAWGQMLLAMAVGFVLAVILIRPWQIPFSAPPASLPRAEPVAQLAIAAGSCEMRPAKGAISTFTCPENMLVERDSILSTGPTMRCELLLEGGNPLCLDTNTEITLHNPQSVEVTLGRMLCPQATEHGLEIKSGGGTITATSASQLAVECLPEAVRLIVVDGTAHVRSGEKSLDVGAGQQVRIVRASWTILPSAATPFWKPPGSIPCWRSAARTIPNWPSGSMGCWPTSAPQNYPTFMKTSCAVSVMAACRLSWPIWLPRARRRTSPRERPPRGSWPTSAIRAASRT